MNNQTATCINLVNNISSLIKQKKDFDERVNRLTEFYEGLKNNEDRAIFLSSLIVYISLIEPVEFAAEKEPTDEKTHNQT
mgnify:CR=1 FL=1